MKQLLVLAIFIFTFSHSIFSCTLGIKGLGEFDKTEFIFIGEVIGYTKPITFKESVNKNAISSTFLSKSKENKTATGLIVKVKENVFLPKTPKSYFEIFPIELWADCSESGTDIEELKKNFPINSEVRVIAKEAKYLAKLSDGNIRLEDRPGELGSISLNTEEDKKFISTKEKIFDYQSFKYIVDEYRSIRSLLPDFEARKDLLRLKTSKTQAEMNQILNRFLQIPPTFDPDLDFYSIFKNYTSNYSEFQKFNETRLKIELTEEEFRQYKVVDDVRNKLLKLGYKTTSIDKAMGKAMSEGVEITNEKVFERTFQILKSAKRKSKN